MRTKLVVAGLVVLVLGVALVAAGESGLLARTTVYKGYSQPGTGEFVSGEIVLNTTSVVDVRSPAANGGLIPANDLGVVNSSKGMNFKFTRMNSATTAINISARG